MDDDLRLLRWFSDRFASDVRGSNSELEFVTSLSGKISELSERIVLKEPPFLLPGEWESIFRSLRTASGLQVVCRAIAESGMFAACAQIDGLVKMYGTKQRRTKAGCWDALIRFAQANDRGTGLIPTAASLSVPAAASLAATGPTYVSGSVIDYKPPQQVNIAPIESAENRAKRLAMEETKARQLETMRARMAQRAERDEAVVRERLSMARSLVNHQNNPAEAVVHDRFIVYEGPFAIKKKKKEEEEEMRKRQMPSATEILSKISASAASTTTTTTTTNSSSSQQKKSAASVVLLTCGLPGDAERVRLGPWLRELAKRSDASFEWIQQTRLEVQVEEDAETRLDTALQHGVQWILVDFANLTRAQRRRWGDIARAYAARAGVVSFKSAAAACVRSLEVDPGALIDLPGRTGLAKLVSSLAKTLEKPDLAGEGLRPAFRCERAADRELWMGQLESYLLREEEPSSAATKKAKRAREEEAAEMSPKRARVQEEEEEAPQEEEEEEELYFPGLEMSGSPTVLTLLASTPHRSSDPALAKIPVKYHAIIAEAARRTQTDLQTAALFFTRASGDFALTLRYLSEHQVDRLEARAMDEARLLSEQSVAEEAEKRKAEVEAARLAGDFLSSKEFEGSVVRRRCGESLARVARVGAPDEALRQACLAWLTLEAKAQKWWSVSADAYARSRALVEPLTLSYVQAEVEAYETALFSMPTSPGSAPDAFLACLDAENQDGAVVVVGTSSVALMTKGEEAEDEDRAEGGSSLSPIELE